VQQNVVRQDGRRSVLLSVLKNGNASTVAVVNGVRKVLKMARAAAPPGLGIHGCSINRSSSRLDRGRAPRRSDRRRPHRADDPALLGSWRSTLIVLISIPLSILASLSSSSLGHTLKP